MIMKEKSINLSFVKMNFSDLLNFNHAVTVECNGLGQLHGTWGELAVIPEVDSFELVSGNVKP